MTTTTGNSSILTLIITDAKLLFSIAIPTILVQIAIYLVFTETASIVGRHLGNDALGGYSLASLTGNITCLSIIIGSLTAMETLCPRAYVQGDYRDVGRIAIAGFVITCVCLCPIVCVLLFFLEPLLVHLGQDPHESQLASSWVRIYVIGVPFVLLFRVIQRFLAAQNVVMPLVYAAILACVVVHPFFLGVFVPTMGFLGSGVAVVATQIVVVLLVLGFVAWKTPHHEGTWVWGEEEGGFGGYVWEALDKERMKDFFHLSVGGVLSLSEWWFWETTCFVAGTFGVVPLCIHSIAYQLTPICFMVPLGLSIGLTVRIASVIETDVPRAKRIAVYSIVFTMILGATISIGVYRFRCFIVALFTTDETIQEGCQKIWSHVSMHIFILHLHGTNQGILRALGLQMRMACATVLSLWIVALPLLYHFSVTQNGGINTLWLVLPPIYVFLQINLCICYVCADWYEISRGVKEKRKAKHNQNNESVEKGDICTENDDELFTTLSERSHLLGRP